MTSPKMQYRTCRSSVRI